MKKTWRMRLMAAAFISLAGTAADAGERFITVATTTSVENSGLLAHLLPQFEAVTLAHLGEQTARYSRIRLWGSVGFVVASAFVGWLLDRTGPLSLAWIMLGFIGLVVAMSFAVHEPSARLWNARCFVSCGKTLFQSVAQVAGRNSSGSDSAGCVSPFENFYFSNIRRRSAGIH